MAASQAPAAWAAKPEAQAAAERQAPAGWAAEKAARGARAEKPAPAAWAAKPEAVAAEEKAETAAKPALVGWEAGLAAGATAEFSWTRSKSRRSFRPGFGRSAGGLQTPVALKTRSGDCN
jgi:hypothetical protein